MNNPIYIRVLQHDKNDQIRIGEAFPATDLEQVEKNIIAQLKQKQLGVAASKWRVNGTTSALQ